ncbi:MAG TPA: cupin domain-containing protein [Pirellulales bacterium]
MAVLQKRSMGGSIALSILVVATSAAFSHDKDDDKVTPPGSGSAIAKVFEQVLPAGDFRKVNVITVSYGPGGKSPKHRHDVAVFAYVAEGDVESQLEGEELKTFHKGEMWYEPPGTIHVVSRNASQEKPAKLLVFLVQEEGKAATTVVK